MRARWIIAFTPDYAMVADQCRSQSNIPGTECGLAEPAVDQTGQQSRVEYTLLDALGRVYSQNPVNNPGHVQRAEKRGPHEHGDCQVVLHPLPQRVAMD